MQASVKLFVIRKDGKPVYAEQYSDGKQIISLRFRKVTADDIRESMRNRIRKCGNHVFETALKDYERDGFYHVQCMISEFLDFGSYQHAIEDHIVVLSNNEEVGEQAACP